jgi:hypothetical protein
MRLTRLPRARRERASRGDEKKKSSASVRQAAQPHARNQNEREVLEDQITIVLEAQT